MEDRLIRPGTAFFELPASVATSVTVGANAGNGMGANANAANANTADNSGNGCGYKTGDLPECAPLAAGFVPTQRDAAP
ncbi:MAG: hypothetical protein LBT36_01810, partial [Oscillospiraceae bacterium]|nr:hypothetical protein [Oscillospiraceae bacterium]